MILILFAYIILMFTIWLVLIGASFIGILARRELGREVGEESENIKDPKILLMVPCKGDDINLVRNLKSAMNQDYKSYRAVAIIESTKDPAYKAISKAGIDYIIGDYKCEGSGKVRSISAALDKFKDYDAYCIMDSDVHVDKSWLSLLAKNLTKGVGISTSFPIFNPIGGFYSKLKHVWGFVGQSLMEREQTRFGWGGSLLFRRELLDGGGLKRFSSSLSDDITLTNMAKDKGLKIVYVPEARPIVDCDETLGSFAEWSNRQSALMALGNRQILKIGIAYYSSSILLLLSAIALSITVSVWYAILLLPFVIGVVGTYMRSNRRGIEILLACASLNFIYLYNMLSASSMRSIRWRGRTYQLR